MKYQRYDYTKVFFRRPIWTEGNVRMALSFILTSFIVLVFVGLAWFKYSNYKEYRIQNQMKHRYIQRIVEFSRNVNNVVEEEQINLAALGIDTSDLESGDDDIVDAVKDALRKESGSARKPVIRTTAAFREPEEYDKSLAAFLKSPSQTSIYVQNAIRNIPNVIKPSPSERFSPMQSYQTRKKAYESGTRELASAKEGGKIDIASADFTDFEVVKGLRSHEETITIARDNEKFVKHCIDRAFRNDPTKRGNIVVRFNIHPEGYVLENSVRIMESDVKDVRVLKCIKRTIRRWRNFPRVQYENGEYVLTQKYIF